MDEHKYISLIRIILRIARITYGYPLLIYYRTCYGFIVIQGSVPKKWLPPYRDYSHFDPFDPIDHAIKSGNEAADNTDASHASAKDEAFKGMLDILFPAYLMVHHTTMTPFNPTLALLYEKVIERADSTSKKKACHRFLREIEWLYRKMLLHNYGGDEHAERWEMKLRHVTALLRQCEANGHDRLHSNPQSNL